MTLEVVFSRLLSSLLVSECLRGELVEEGLQIKPRGPPNAKAPIEVTLHY